MENIRPSLLVVEMLRFVSALLLNFFIISNACKSGVSKDEIQFAHQPNITSKYGVSSLTTEDLSDPSFQSALIEVLKHLEEVNKCHSFQIISVVDPTKQTVDGVRYDMNLKLRSFLAEENEEDCSDVTYSLANGKKNVEVSVLIQDWKDPKYILTFNPNSDFESDGTMKLKTKLDTWCVMTPEELEMSVFQKAIQGEIDKLNRVVDKCFHYEFVGMVDGEKMLSSKLHYKWRVKVKKVYEYQRQECLGRCVDDCSGTDLYLARSFMSPHESETPQVTDFTFIKRLSPSFADNYARG
nr:proteinase inhibitor I25 cystatin [Hymenolepis microstoma]